MTFAPFDITDDNGTATVSCAPDSGTTFPLGATAVSCTATDPVTLEPTPFGFTVTVVDTTSPTISAPANITAEATSSAGATVTYVASASDLVDGSDPVSCVPASGSVFPLGATTVTCNASDAAANAAAPAGFSVTVVDTTPPSFSLSPITAAAPSAGGAVVTYTANATDAVDGTIPGVCSPVSGAVFPVGVTTVNCQAADAAGNTGNGTFTVTVTPPPAAPASNPPATTPAPTPAPTPSPSVPAAPARQTPPAAVTGVTAQPGDHRVNLSWHSPGSSTQIEVDRRLNTGGPVRTVYTGRSTTFVDTHLDNGVAYRYVIFALNSAGDESAGVAVIVTPHEAKLVRPADGSTLTSPPMLRWVATPGASYYNVQLFRNGHKVLSAWPGDAHYSLGKTWRFGNKIYEFSTGTYRWYVWPGYGPHRGRTYGPLIGTSAFLVPA